MSQIDYEYWKGEQAQRLAYLRQGGHKRCEHCGWFACTCQASLREYIVEDSLTHEVWVFDTIEESIEFSESYEHPERLI